MDQLFTYFKKAYESARRNVLCKFRIEFGVNMNLFRLIKLCLNETYSRVCIVENWTDMFPVKSGMKRGDVLSPLLFKFALEYAIR